MGSNFKRVVTFTYIVFTSQFIGLIYIYSYAIKLTTKFNDVGVDVTVFIPIIFLVAMFFLFRYVIKTKKYLIFFYISFSIFTSFLLYFMFNMYDILYHLGAFF